MNSVQPSVLKTWAIAFPAPLLVDAPLRRLITRLAPDGERESERERERKKYPRLSTVGHLSSFAFIIGRRCRASDRPSVGLSQVSMSCVGQPLSHTFSGAHCQRQWRRQHSELLCPSSVTSPHLLRKKIYA